MNFKIVLVLLLAVLLPTLVSCGKEKTPPLKETAQLKFDTLKIHEPHLSDLLTTEGHIFGNCSEKGEAYVQRFSRKTKTFTVDVIDLAKGTVRQTVQLTAGDRQAPGAFFSPTYMQRLDDNYIIIDQFHKISIFDQRVQHLYTNMYTAQRFFIDFFKRQDQLFFVIATSHWKKDATDSPLEIYRHFENKKPELLQQLDSFSFPAFHGQNEQNRKRYTKGMFWPSVTGFESGGKIYYAVNTSPQIFQYDIAAGKTKKIHVPYLEGRQFTGQEAEQLGRYTSGRLNLTVTVL